MVAGEASLVKYESPVLVSTADNKGKKAKKGAKSAPSRKEEKSVSSTGERLPADERLPVDERLEILNSILPPKEWTKDGQVWIQSVSVVPATTVDVVKLKDSLDIKLQEQHARSTGICPIREELYTQCFDELIRQVTIICAERGIALLSVRDEVNMTCSNYQSLYQSSVAFGMRKALQGQQRSNGHEDYIKGLYQEIRDLHEEVTVEMKRIERFERENKERRDEEARKHQEEVDAQKTRIMNLEDQIIDIKKQAKRAPPPIL
jgi:dynein light intermediate chain